MVQNPGFGSLSRISFPGRVEKGEWSVYQSMHWHEGAFSKKASSLESIIPREKYSSVRDMGKFPVCNPPHPFIPAHFRAEVSIYHKNAGFCLGLASTIKETQALLWRLEREWLIWKVDSFGGELVALTTSALKARKNCPKRHYAITISVH